MRALFTKPENEFRFVQFFFIHPVLSDLYYFLLFLEKTYNPKSEAKFPGVKVSVIAKILSSMSNFYMFLLEN